VELTKKHDGRRTTLLVLSGDKRVSIVTSIDRDSDCAAGVVRFHSNTCVQIPVWTWVTQCQYPPVTCIIQRCGDQHARPVQTLVIDVTVNYFATGSVTASHYVCASRLEVQFLPRHYGSLLIATLDADTGNAQM
jgi:hypothetical protein